MSSSPLLQRFIDDELVRAPLLIDEVLQSIERPGSFDGARSIDRRTAHDLQAALHGQHAAMVARFCESLREQLGRETAAGDTRRAAPRGLSLVDDEEVNTDVELSRTVEAIASVAEFELRELGSFTSAIVGDLQVARDTNPFKPEVYASALWASAGVLPLSRGFRVAFMRQAAMPLARSLRLAYAAACTRLEDAGVEPGTYSTLILPAGTRSARPSEQGSFDTRAGPDLPALRDSMPVPLDEATPGAAADGLPRIDLGDSPANRVDQQSIELLSRLFDAILTDRTLAPPVQLLLSRLQASVLRVALRDSVTLDSYSHPVWQFMDRVAFGAELRPVEDDPQRVRLLGTLQGLVANIAAEPTQDAELFRWGLERLAALDRHLFEQRVAGAAEQIVALQMQGDTPPTTAQPIDVVSLETVPAELLESGAESTRDTAAWLRGHASGAWVDLFVQGGWHTAQLLWHTDALWLYAGDEATWALRRNALERLHAEGLVRALRPRSLVRKAAEQVLRALPA